MASKQKRRKAEKPNFAEAALGRVRGSLLISLFDYWLLEDINQVRQVSKGWRAANKTYWSQPLLDTENSTEQKRVFVPRAKLLTLKTRLVPKVLLNEAWLFFRGRHWKAAEQMPICKVDDRKRLKIPGQKTDPLVPLKRATHVLVDEESRWISTYTDNGRIRCVKCDEPYDNDNPIVTCDFCSKSQKGLWQHRACKSCFYGLHRASDWKERCECELSKGFVNICDLCSVKYECIICNFLGCSNCMRGYCYVCYRPMCSQCETDARNNPERTCCGPCGIIVCSWNCTASKNGPYGMFRCDECKVWSCSCSQLPCQQDPYSHRFQSNS